MSKARPPVPVPPPAASFWLPYTIIGLIGVLIGATTTYLVLLPRLRPASSVESAPEVARERTSHLPAPELTAGQTPAQADLTKGNFYYDHQNWVLAIASYESAIRQGIDNPDIRTDLANAYRFAGRIDDALAQYGRAQQMNPAHEFSLFNQGGLYLEDLKQPAKAIEIWQEYLVRFPTGRNVVAARQLIAQAQTGLSGLLPAAVPNLDQPSATEQLILQKIKAGNSKSSQP